MTIKGMLNGKMTDFDDMTEAEQIEIFGEGFVKSVQRLRARKEKVEIDMIDVSYEPSMEMLMQGSGCSEQIC